MIQDVVYNHLGPSGNYLPEFFPVFTEGGANTWGNSINLSGPDSDEVRRYILDNALMWLRDMHVDGLRLDAVHALVDERATHVLEEMAQEVDRLAVAVGRPLSLIAESDLNDPRMVTPRVAGGMGLTAQWSDDFHHALHATLTGEGQGYYSDFAAAGVGGLAKVLTGAFFHDGAWSSFRRRHHGRPVDTALLPGWKFLGYLQDHDQIGNRAVGDRISASLSPGLLAVGATIVLTSPFTPMLFMGEEWGASTPWQFFTSHPEPELGRATAEGRIGEFAEHGWDADVVPDPQDPETFTRSKLDWSELGKEPHARLLDRPPDAAGAAQGPARARRPRPDGGPRRVRRRPALAGRAPRHAAGGGQPVRPAAGDPARPAGHRRGLRDRRRADGGAGDRDHARGVRGRR